MLAAIEKVLLDEKPDAVLVYGDTNSTLAGALAAVKLHIPVGHVEGGMRSFNRRMPEEINRVLTDHVATWHFCPTETAIENLKDEGIAKGVHLVGDVMYDAIMLYKDVARGKSDILQRLNISKYALATIHRAENTDDRMRLRNILEALVEISKDMAVVLPLHPRTKKAIENADLSPLITTEPLSYLDTLCLEQSASIILTDSGGMQKEAFWLGVPCVTMRDETEWVETVDAGMNKVVGADKNSILRAFREFMNSERHASQPRSASCQTAASKMIIECLPSGI
jgi:UDP-N-acetylglucosamine 2-epimerase